MELNATFLVAMVSFILFIAIMNKIYYKPILNIINERKNLIDGNYCEAQNSREQAGMLLADKEQKLLFASKEAKEIVNDRVNVSAQDAHAQIDAAKQRSQAEVAEEKSRLNDDAQRVDLTEHVEDLAQRISSKILGGRA